MDSPESSGPDRHPRAQLTVLGIYYAVVVLVALAVGQERRGGGLEDNLMEQVKVFLHYSFEVLLRSTLYGK